MRGKMFLHSSLRFVVLELLLASRSAAGPNNSFKPSPHQGGA
jgi:hypothetical protein